MSAVLDTFLAQVLSQYDADSGTITLGANIDQQVADLLAYAQESQIPLTQATVVSTSSRVTVTGDGPMNELGGQQAVVLCGVDVGGALGLTLEATPQSPLDLASVFPGLAPTTQAEGLLLVPNQSLFYQLAYQSPLWTLTDIAPPEAVIYPAVGLNLAADVDLREQFPHVVSLTGRSSVRFAGPVSFPADAPTQLYLDAAFPGFSMAVGTMQMHGFHLLIRTVYYQVETERNFTGTIFTGILDISSGVTARIGVDTQVVPAGDPSSSIWAFFSDFDTPLTLEGGLSALAGFVGGDAMSFDMPASVRVLGDFGLTSVNVGANPYDPTDIEFVFLEVGSPKTWDPPIPYVTVEDLHVQWQIQRPFDDALRSQSGGVGGTLVFGKTNPVHLDVIALIPEYIINANLREGDQISVVDALSEWFPDAGGLSQDLIIDDLQIVANFSSKVYEFQGSVRPEPPFTIDLVITTLTLERVTLNTNYSQDQLYGTVLAELALFRAPWRVSATYLRPSQGAAGNWSFLVQLVPGNVVPLSELVAELLSFEPADVPAVNITELFFKYDLADRTYAFKGAVQGSWPLDIIPGQPALEATAAVALSSYLQDQQTAYKGSIDGTLAVGSLKVGVGYAFDPTNSNYTFAISYKQRALYATLTRTTKTIEGQQVTASILTVRFGDLSVGEIIEYLVNLANPYADFQLSAPWDILDSLNFKNLQLVIDLTNDTVGVEYRFDLELLFLYIESLGLTYFKRPDGKGGVALRIKGRFLDTTFGDGDELAWDLLNDPAPAVPGRGSKLFDLEYLGIGQHVALQDPVGFESVADVIDALERNMLPVANPDKNPLGQPLQHGLVFDKDSHWLFGVRFTVLGGIDLSAVFNDPYLYGLLLELGGDVAGSLAGLKFELLYKRITDNLGVFKVVLRVPDAFRQLELGEVSITLPIIKVDIYTNGNFKVDLGFPTDDSFSESFAVQVFPFIGKGGLYFGYLTGAASDSVPRITNGQFSPVIELGLALAVGVGKEINKGPLSAGLSLTVQAIMEGTLAWFHAYNDDVPTSMYYWVRGTAALVGKLYGAVDFKVIKVSVSVTAKASVTLTVESHMPIEVALTVEVSVKASVKVLFVRVHFSFDLDLDLSFTIGAQTPTPWVIDPSAPLPHQDLRLRQNRALPLGRRQGLQKRAVHPLQRLQWATPLNLVPAKRFAPARSKSIHCRLRDHHIEGGLLAYLPFVRLAAHPVPTFDWAPIPVFSATQSIPVLVLPMLTVAANSDLLPADRGSGTVSNQVPLSFLVENGIHPQAADLASLRRRTAEHAHATSDEDALPFNLLVEGMLAWSIASFLHDPNILEGSIDRDELEALSAALNQADARGDGFTTTQLQGFFDQNYVFRVGTFTGDPSQVNATSGTFMPLLPPMTMHLPGRTAIDFASYRQVGSKYEDAVAAYFAQMEIDYGVDSAVDPFGAVVVTPSGAPESLAQMVQRDYFMMVARNATQVALDLMDAMPQAVTAADSLASIAALYPRIDMHHTVVAGETVTTVMKTYDMTLAALQAKNPGVDFDAPLVPGTVLVVLEGPTVNSIVEANRNAGGLLAAGARVDISGAKVQVQAGQSLAQIAGDMHVALADLVSDNATSTKLLAAGYDFALPAFTYTSVAGDTLDFVAAWLLVRNGEQPAVAGQAWTTLEQFAWYEQAVAALNYAGGDYIDFSQPIPAGTTIRVPPSYLQSDPSVALRYSARSGDTLRRIAGYFTLVQNPTPGFIAFRDSLSASGDPAPGAPLPAGTAVGVPAWLHRIQPLDSLDSFTAALGLTVAQVEASSSISDPALLVPLAVVLLPTTSYRIPDADQTFATLASTFDMELDDLALSLADQNGYFTDTGITIPEVATLEVATLLSQVEQNANEVASTCSRFMLHGLRLPLPPDDPDDPPDMSTLYGMYEMIGQQVSIDQLTLPLTISLTTQDAPEPPARPGGIELFDTYLVQSGDTFESLLEEFPDLLAYNPGLTPADIRPGLLLFATLATQLDIELDQGFVDANQASPSLTLSWTDPLAAQPLAEANPVRYTLSKAVHWQTPAPPAWAGHRAIDSAAPGEPSIWLFPDNLLDKIADAAWAGHDYELLVGDVDDAGTMQTRGLAYDDWATVIEIGIQRIPETPVQLDSLPALQQQPQGNTSGFLPNTYQVLPGGSGVQRLLLGLWQHIAGNPAEAAASIALLMTPSSQSDNPAGFTSQAVDPAKTFLIKSNLSTLSTSGAASAAQASARLAARDVNGAPVAAAIENPLDFLQMLWEAGVVGTGGYFLNYLASEQGLPDSIFESDNTATLRVLVILPSQSAESNPTRSFYGFNNCAVVGDNITIGSANVFVQRSDGSETVSAATMPPGVFALQGTLANPGSEAPNTGVDEWRTRTLYSMLGYATAAGGAFVRSNQALPIGPAVPPQSQQQFRSSADQDDYPWYYQQNVPAYELVATYPLSPAPHLPAPERDPYAGTSPGACIAIDFAMHDVYGNELVPTDPIAPLDLPVGYTDELIALSEWPGTTSSYVFTGDGTPAETARVRLSLAFQTASYIPGAGSDFAAAQFAVSAHRLKYSAIYYQVEQAGVSLSLTTSVMANPATGDGSFPLDPTIARQYVQAVYTFLSAAARIVQASFAVTEAGTTFTSLTRTYPVTVAALGEANRAAELARLFAQVQVPSFAVFPQQATLAGVAAQAGLDAATLAAQNTAVALSPRVRLRTPVRRFTAEADRTLVEIAARELTAVDDIGTSNASTPGILTEDTPVTVEGVTLLVQGDETLDDLVLRFAEQGVTTNPQTICVANEDTRGLIAGGSALDVNVYVIQPGDTFDTVTARFPAWTAAQLGADSADVPNVFVQGASVYLGPGVPVTPAAGDTFAGYALTYDLSVAQLAQANADRGLLQGSSVRLPNLAAVDASSGAVAVPYSIPAGVNWNDILANLGLTTGAEATNSMTANQDTPDLLVGGVTVSIGSDSTTTTDTSTFATVLDALNAGGSQYGYSDLSTAIGDVAGLMKQWGCMAVAMPAVPAGSSLNDTAARFNVAPQALAVANAAMQDLVQAGRDVTIGGVTITTVSGDTFAIIVGRFQSSASMTVSVEQVAAAVGSDSGFLIAGTPVVLPPKTTALDATLYTSIPVPPPYPAEVFALETSVSITRPSDEIHPDFTDAPAVREATSGVAPHLETDDTGSYILTQFARDTETIFSGLKVAVGHDQGTRAAQRLPHLFLVSFASNGFAQVDITPDNPVVFAIQPIVNREVSAREVPIRPLNEDGTLGTAAPQDFDAVDLDLYAQQVMAATELLLAAGLAAPAYELDPAGFESIVAAKASLADTVSRGLTAVIAGSDTSGLGSAKERLRQALLTDLSAGFAVDAVVQYPSTARSSGATSANLSGKPVPVLESATPGETDAVFTLALSASSTFESIASFFGIPMADIVAQLATVTPLLEPGGVFLYPGQVPYVVPDATTTLGDVAQHFGLSDATPVAEYNRQVPGYFTPGTVISITMPAPDFTISTAKTSLDTGSGHVDFLITVPDERRHKTLLMNLDYQINELEYDIVPVAGSGGFSSSKWLGFVIPITNADRPAAVGTTLLGQADVPVVLRSLPQSPNLKSQSFEEAVTDLPDTFPDSLLAAKEWIYHVDFEQNPAAQDSTFLTVNMNRDVQADASAAAQLSPALRALFDALAQLNAVSPSLQPLLLGLLDPAAIASQRQTLINAIDTFATLVTQVADAWGAYWTESGVQRREARALAPESRAFEVVQVVDPLVAPPVLRSLVLLARDGGDGYPRDQYPDIAVWDKASRTYQPLLKQPGTSRSEVAYTYPEDVRAFARQRYRYSFSGLDAVAQQNAWPELMVKRNLELLPDAVTADELVYQTPRVTFTNPMYPAMVRNDIINARTSPNETLAEALSAIYANLLGAGADDSFVKVTVRYGYTLAVPIDTPAGSAPSGDAVISELPVLYWPKRQYDDDYQATLLAAIDAWFSTHDPARTNGAYIFEITVYSNLNPDTTQPVLVLQRVAFPIT